MKKKLYKVIFVFFIAFLINCVNVNAVDICNYGFRDGDDASTWKKQLQLEVRGWTNANIVLNVPESPYFNNVTNTVDCSDEKYCVLHGQANKDWSGYFFDDSDDDIDFYVYASYFPNQTVYDNIEGKKCPGIFKYEEYTVSGVDSKDIYLSIFNDDLDKDNTDHGASLLEYLKSKIGLTKKLDGYFILEEEKDTPLEDLKDEFDCITYSSGLNEIRKAIDANSNKSCDNNPRFNEKFQTLKELCSTFRSTADYATDDEGQTKAKSCSKACSLINDHVAEMCGVTPDTVACGSLGAKIVKWMYRIIRIVRYVVPIILILLSILEFVKALSDEDKMKDATKHFVHRLIAAALIFIIPFILDFLLKIFSIPGLNNPFCT